MDCFLVWILGREKNFWLGTCRDVCSTFLVYTVQTNVEPEIKIKIKIAVKKVLYILVYTVQTNL